ncbi:MAG: glycoside hydrolase [Segetibacter sp.]|nr:glycoside hydrolase [Segetibacter sp.]
MKKFVSAFIAALLSAMVFGQAKTATNNNLFQGFQSPGNPARPLVWWHWMNGNITKEGIRKDLLWMHRSGIGGFQLFQEDFATPKIVEKQLPFMTAEWKDAFGFATKLADSLKLEMAIAGSPGWSESGGPWVPAKDGMKKLVWREVRVKSGQPFSGTLPKPYTTSGAFQNLPIEENIVAATAKAVPPPEYYKDIAVVAFRLPESDVSLMELAPKVTSSGGNFTLAQLTDGDLAGTTLLPRDSAGGYSWIQFEFQQPQTIKGLSIVGGVKEAFGIVASVESRRLEVSDDGLNFRKVASIPLGGVAQQTIAIPATTSKYFRLAFQNPQASNQGGSMGGGAPPAGTRIAEIVLHPATRINHVEEKAGFAATYDIEKYPTPSSNDAIAEGDVINLTGKMTADGRLNWTPPPTGGEWKIIRFGYSLTGKRNHPASSESIGLEVDKMDARAVKDYFENYLNQHKEASGGLMGSRSFQYMINDSWEAGQENWTPAMAEEFQKRRNYSLLRWLPVFTGQVVKSTEASEAFLWDWRKTIAELIAENHYDQLTDILVKYGMKRYSESHENGRILVADGMDIKRKAGVPMAALWVPTQFGSTLYMAQADMREAASVAHIYGQNLAAAESLTVVGMAGNAWSYHPGNLKPTIDFELASGINRFAIQASAHQPVDNKLPGIGLGPVGIWFNRLDTWAEQAKAWTDYLARSSYLLQQGKFVADVVYYYGEDNNITGLFGDKLPDVPKGYNYDFINPHALINLLSVKEGKLVTPSGMSYRLLVLDSNAKRMSLPVLRKIVQLVKAGAAISGIKPEMTASMKDDPQEFQRLIAEVWSSGNSTVHTGKTIGEVLSSLNIQPDFEYSEPQGGPELLYVHRKTINADIYWVNNRNDKPENVEATFRVSGKIPQIWHPETGKTEPASYKIANGRTTVSLNLAPNDAVFVVFGSPAAKTSVTLPAKTEKEIVPVDGSWNITFQPNRGAPANATFDKLTSWTENSDAGIKYFSGTATYTKTIQVPANAIIKGAEVWLDLGDAGNLAEVIINGKSLGVLWKKPYRVDVTRKLKAGVNDLQIKVTNLWVNRLIGDKQPGTTNKITWTAFPYYKADSPLQPSGLLGPVRILSVK